jgi:hypothetical protein
MWRERPVHEMHAEAIGRPWRSATLGSPSAIAGAGRSIIDRLVPTYAIRSRTRWSLSRVMDDAFSGGAQASDGAPYASP